MNDDKINHPKHYNDHPSGIECIQVIEHMSFNLGNAVKYIWRADLKGNALEDLGKAAWYVQREIAKRGGTQNTEPEDDGMVPYELLWKVAEAVRDECGKAGGTSYLQRVTKKEIGQIILQARKDIASVREG